MTASPPLRSCIAALLGAMPCQDPGVTARLDRDVVPQGEAVRLDVELVDPTLADAQLADDALASLEAAGFRVEPLGETLEGDGEQRTFTWSFRLFPQRTGVLTIPPLAVEVAESGLHLASAPVELRVEAPAGGPAGEVAVQCTPSRVYPGQTLLVDLELRLRDVPQEPGGLAITWTEVPDLGRLVPVAGGTPGSVAVELAPAVARQLALERVEFQRREAGTGVDLSAAFRVTVQRVPAALRVAFRVTTRGAGGVLREELLRGELGDLQVLPLPLVPAGATFSGAFGRFQLRSAALPELEPGASTMWVLEVSGTGDLEDAAPPPLPPLESALVSAPTVAEGPGWRRWTYQVTPLRLPVLLPAAHWTYFDPQLGSYETVHAIAVEIRAPSSARVRRGLRDLALAAGALLVLAACAAALWLHRRGLRQAERGEPPDPATAEALLDWNAVQLAAALGEAPRRCLDSRWDELLAAHGLGPDLAGRARRIQERLEQAVYGGAAADLAELRSDSAALQHALSAPR